MNFKKELPKLGKNIDDEISFCVDKQYSKSPIHQVSFEKEFRPDYEKLKSKKFNLEIDCVSMIVGLKYPDQALFVFKKATKGARKAYQNSIEESEKTMNYDHYCYFSELIDLFREIRRDVDIGLKNGEIIHDGEDFSGRVLSTKRDFSHILSCDTLSFLNWMQSQGYPIPKELAIGKNDHAETVWADDSFTGKDSQELGRLKAEKKAMDSTINAAVQLGIFIKDNTDAGLQLKRKDVIDFIHGIDRNIPNTRIDQIWNFIPDEFKHGPGRPKKI